MTEERMIKVNIANKLSTRNHRHHGSDYIYSGICGNPTCGEIFYGVSLRSRFCSPTCSGAAIAGVLNPKWNGGRTKNKEGYIIVSGYKGHPHAYGGRCQIAEYTIVMERFLGRYLTSNEYVHHKNGIRDDNRIENLELWTTHHPTGQRVSDVIKFAVDAYPELVIDRLNSKSIEIFEDGGGI